MRAIAELPIQTNLTYSDFEILDVIVTKEKRVFTIGPKTYGIFISRKEAFALYKKGEILQKTYDIDGDQIFCEVR